MLIAGSMDDVAYRTNLDAAFRYVVADSRKKLYRGRLPTLTVKAMELEDQPPVGRNPIDEATRWQGRCRQPSPTPAGTQRSCDAQPFRLRESQRSTAWKSYRQK